MYYRYYFLYHLQCQQIIVVFRLHEATRFSVATRLRATNSPVKSRNRGFKISMKYIELSLHLGNSNYWTRQCTAYRDGASGGSERSDNPPVFSKSQCTIAINYNFYALGVNFRVFWGFWPLWLLELALSLTAYKQTEIKSRFKMLDSICLRIRHNFVEWKKSLVLIFIRFLTRRWAKSVLTLRNMALKLKGTIQDQKATYFLSLCLAVVLNGVLVSGFWERARWRSRPRRKRRKNEEKAVSRKSTAYESGTQRNDTEVSFNEQRLSNCSSNS